MQNELHHLREIVAKLTADLQALQVAHAKLQADHEALQSKYKALETENKLLRSQNDFLKRQLFGKKSERLDPNQLELQMAIEEAACVIEAEARGDDDEPSRRKRRPGGERKVVIPDSVQREEVVIDPEEVKADPDSYVYIGEEVTEQLDVVATPYILRVTRRRKFKSKTDRQRPPLLAPAPASLLSGSLLGPGLATDIAIRKYVDHLPLARQEKILRRYGIVIPRQTLCDWVGVIAGWLRPIYEAMRKEMRLRRYLQVDESPIRYCRAEGGGSRQGYVWVFHDPGGDVLFEWHLGRGSKCLEGMLDKFFGILQCDGHTAYPSYADGREGVVLAGCWAHARRNFFEALNEAPGLARWFLHQIGLLYQVETDLRARRAGPSLRQAVRAAQSRMILRRIKKTLVLKLAQHLPKTRMGEAIGYALNQWDKLIVYVENGEVEIDNNLVENAIRPTAVGKKNWLFFGSPKAGQRSAIIYSILESCKRRGIDPAAYLRDVLARLPTMKNTEVAQLTPANWLAARKSKAA